MGNPVTATQIYPALKALLGLPDMCTKFELRVSHSDIVTVACEYYPSMDAKGIAQLTAVLGEYELVRREEVAPPPAEAMDFDAWMRERTERAHAEFMARTSIMLGGDRRKVLTDLLYKNVARPLVLRMAEAARIA